MTDFYRAFEDKHRGSRALILERLKIYLPFVLPLQEIYPSTKIVDLGCGRGEWLQLLKQHDFEASGVDIDEQMLTACRELLLPVMHADALSYLAQQSADSLSAISAFHVVEHIAFSDLQQLVTEAFRVLKPGGLLIMETPNPENIIVGTNNFYLDPSHQKPIPQQLLSFVAEFQGFARVKVLRLQENPNLHDKDAIALTDVIGGVSPDYAVIAQKAAEPALLAQFDNAFNQEYGLSLPELLGRWEQNVAAILAKQLETQQRVAELQNLQRQQNKTIDSLKLNMHESSEKLAFLEKRVLDKGEINTQLLSSFHVLQQQATSAELKATNSELQTMAIQQRFDDLQKYVETTLTSLAERYSFRLAASEQSTSLNAEVYNELASAKQTTIQHLQEISQLKADLVASRQLNQQYQLELQTYKTELDNVHAANHQHYTNWQATLVELSNVHNANHQHWLLAEQRQRQINALLSSWSWRLTWPLRVVLSCIKSPIKYAINVLKWPFIWPAKKLVAKVLANPQQAIRINNWLIQKAPFLHRHLRQFASHRGLMQMPAHSAPQPLPVIQTEAVSADSQQPDLSHLSPHARKIYLDLAAAIAKNKE